jgi:hypothetical protein
MTSSIVIFNQYYYDLLTKIRTIAKKHKDNSTTASKVLESMKDNYKEFDKTSNEYILYLNETCNEEFWTTYLNTPKEECDDWLKKDDVKEIKIFKDISIADISKLLRDNFLCHHYLSVFFIYKNELTDDTSAAILKILQSFDDNFELNDNEDFKKIIARLIIMKSDKVKSDSGFDAMDNLKDTTIGKIAKEIIQDVDINKLKQTLNNNDGDIFKALASEESGLSELFSSVGSKVSSKISSGELNQEAIMQDAMKFASMISPGMFGNQEGNKGGGDNSFNMADMMKMMGAMNMMGGKKTKTNVNKQGMRNMAKREELRKKLSNKK